MSSKRHSRATGHSTSRGTRTRSDGASVKPARGTSLTPGGNERAHSTIFAATASSQR